MQLKIESTLSGNELIDIFLQQLKANNIEATAADIMINVQSKDKVIQLTPDRINLSYSKVHV